MSDDAGADVGRARHGIGGLARRIRPVGRLSVGILPDGRGHLQRRVLHALRFEPEFAAVVPRPVAIWYATWPCATRLVVQVLDGQRAPAPPGAVRASIPHVPAYLLGYHDGRRELLDIFARRSARADELAEVGAAFAPLVGWGHRVVWGDVFRGSPVLPNVEFLRGYAGCPVPEGLELAVDLALDAYERIAAQQGQVAARSHWDTSVGELKVDRLLDRVDYDAVRLPILVVDEQHRLVIGRPWLVFGVERKSGMPHGYFLSWEPPNYRSVMECLLFGILPKPALNARFPSLRGPWECEGLPRARSTSTCCRARPAFRGSRASSRVSFRV